VQGDETAVGASDGDEVAVEGVGDACGGGLRIGIRPARDQGHAVAESVHVGADAFEVLVEGGARLVGRRGTGLLVVLDPALAPEPDLVAGGEQALDDALAIDVRPVHALQVDEDDAIAATADFRVMPRHFVGDQHDVVVLGASERRDGLADRHAHRGLSGLFDDQMRHGPSCAPARGHCTGAGGARGSLRRHAR